LVTEPGTGLRASPYKGLAHYEEEDARFFFGRERDREIIRANLAARRLTLLYGESGVGKSSVLRAGVVHELRERALQNIAEGRPPQFVPVVFSSWRDDPVSSLVAAVRRAVAELVGETDGSPASRLEDGLAGLAARAGGELLLVLDQFEEYFLYHGDESGEDTFAESFPRAINRSDLRARFLISIREDALAQLDRFKRRLPRLFENTLRISHLDIEAARAAIEGPIAEYNGDIGSAAAVELEPQLVEEVLQQVQSGRVVLLDQQQGTPVANGGPPRFEAPYIQLVMTRLWAEEARRGSRVLRLSTLKELGGAGEIMRTHLDAALDELSPEDRETAAAALRFLVTPSGSKIAHVLPDLVEFTGRSAEELRPVLKQLSSQERRILRPVADQGATAEPRYELYHDVLAPAIIDWRRRFGQAELERQRADAEQRARRERRKARLAAAAAGAFLLLAAFAVAVGVWAIHQKRVAQSERQLARSRALLTAASDQLDKRLDRGILLSLEAYHTRPSAETRSGLVRAVERTDRLTHILAPAGRAEQVVFNRDGSRLASVEGDHVTVWDSRTGRPVMELSALGIIVTAAFSSDGSRFLVASYDRGATIWDLRRHQPLSSLAASRPYKLNLVAAAISADGSRILTVSVGGHVILWDSKTGRPLRTVSLGAVTRAASGPGAVAVLGRNGLSVFRIDGERRQLTRRRLHLQGNWAPVDLAVGADGRYVGALSASRVATVWDLESNARPRTFSAGQGASALAIGPAGHEVAVGHLDGRLAVYSRNHALVQGSAAGSGQILDVAFDPDGKTIASTGRDEGTVRLTAVGTSSLERTLVVGSPVNEVGFSAEDSDLAAAGHGFTLWRTSNGTAERSALPGAEMPRAFAFADRGTALAVANDRSIALTHPGDGRTEVLVRGHLGVIGMSFRGGVLAWLGENLLSPIGLYDVSHRRLLRPLHLPRPDVSGLALSPDGKLLALASYHRGVTIWDLGSRKLVGTPSRSEDCEVCFAPAVAFAPDGNLLAVAVPNQVFLWSVAASRRIRTLVGADVRDVAFSRDGRTLAGSTNNEVLLWDVQSGDQLGAPLRADAASSVDFSAGDHLLAAGTSDGVKLWTNILWSNVGEMQRRLCAVVSRNLTRDEWQNFVGGHYRRTCG
jgi:WD40 repeat protein